MDRIKLHLPQQKGKKKGGPIINAFFICIGDSLIFDYSVEEDGKSYNYQLTVESGDAFVISSDVQGMEIGVMEVKSKTSPAQLKLREGALLLTVERE